MALGQTAFSQRSRQQPPPPIGLSCSATDLPALRGRGPCPLPSNSGGDCHRSCDRGTEATGPLSCPGWKPAGRDPSPHHPLAESHRTPSQRRPGEPRRHLGDGCCFRRLRSEFCGSVIAQEQVRGNRETRTVLLDLGGPADGAFLAVRSVF